MFSRKPSIYSLLAVGACFLFLSGNAHARLLRILHTNDLHSHMEKGSQNGLGSFAAVKALMDDLKAEAASKGIDTLTLDAGDFSEGGLLYLADRGRAVWSTMNAMGYDAVVLGNHDWFTGRAELERLLGDTSPRFAFLGANFPVYRGEPNLAHDLKATYETEKSGARIAVLGLTTNDWSANWSAAPPDFRNNIVRHPKVTGPIRNPIQVAGELVPGIRERNDFVIALTHIGVNEDVKLVKKNRGIDLVIGGHSHTALFKALQVKDRDGKIVPIVQAGEHGHYVGDLLVDVEPGKPLRVVSYELRKVAISGRKDPGIQERVREARAQLEAQFGEGWLSKVIGQSDVPLTKNRGSQGAWGTLLTDSYREATGADVAVDAPDFTDPAIIPPGPVTREDIMTLYPHVYTFERPMGWEVWVGQMKGFLLKVFLSELAVNESPYSISGVKFRVSGKGSKKEAYDLKVGEKPIDDFRTYRVAIAEPVARAYKMHIVGRQLMRHIRSSGRPIWDAVEKTLHHRQESVTLAP